MSSDERLLLIDDLVYTNVGVEIGLNVFEHDDGTVSASTSVAQVSTCCLACGSHASIPELATSLHGGRESDGIMEGETE